MKAIIPLMIVGLIVSIVAFVFLSPVRLTGSASKTEIITNILIEPEYAQIRAGEDVLIGLKLVNTGNGPRRDVVIHSLLSDDKGLLTEINSQTVALETQASAVLSLQIPQHLEPGTYNVLIEVRDVNNGLLLSSASQRIIVEPLQNNPNKKNALYITGLIVLGIIVIGFIILFYNILKNMRASLKQTSQIISGRLDKNNKHKKRKV
jgi:uncharacterized membrane protein